MKQLTVDEIPGLQSRQPTPERLRAFVEGCQRRATSLMWSLLVSLFRSWLRPDCERNTKVRKEWQ